MTSGVEEEIFSAVDDYEEANQSSVMTQMVFIGHVGGVPQYVPASVQNMVPSRDIPANSGLDPGSSSAFLP